MRRLSVRRSSRRAGGTAETVALALGGLALGFLGGFLAGGLVGPVRRERLRHAVASWGQAEEAPRATGREAVGAIRTALTDTPGLDDRSVDVILVRKNLVELHGWVATRRDGVRALRQAREAAPGLEVVGRLRVRGEDDRAPETDEGERQPA